MESRNPPNYNEIFTPSAPARDPRQDFIHQPSSIGTHPGYTNAGFQDGFNTKSDLGPTPPPPQQPINTTYMPHQSDTNDSYCGRLFQNRRQFSSVAAGFLLMMSSGLHIGWGIWRAYFTGVWTMYSTQSILIFIIMAWSVGACVGGFLGAILATKWRKVHIYYLSGAGMLVGNLMYIIWDRDAELFAAARVLLGVSHGIAYVTVITHAGENAARNLRGTSLSVVNCMLYTGIFVSVVITGTVKFDWYGYPETVSADRVLAIVGLLLATAGLGCAVIASVESVPYLLQRNQHAMTNLKLIRSSAHDTLALAQELEEFQLMNAQDQQNDWNIFTNGNDKPLAVMTLMRLIVALTNNFLMNVIALSYAQLMFSSFIYRIIPIAVVAPRFGMSIIQLFYADIYKRKVQFVFSTTLAGITLIVTGIILNTFTATSYGQLRTASHAIGFLWLFFQLSCSIGMDQMQDVYLSEAFSTAKKRWSLAFVAGVEHLFHIFMIGMYFVGINTTAQLNTIIFVSAIWVVVFGIIIVVKLPETRNMSLKQAKDSFLNYSVNFRSPFA